MKKRSHGDYVLFYHKSKKDFIGEIEKQFKYNDKILRYLTVKSIEETEEVA
ncbi:MAG: 30S ribosomal protein S6 [Fibrobacterota bacterium]